MSKKGVTKYTKKVLKEAVVGCVSLSDLARKLTKSGKAHGSMVAYLKKKLDEQKIDYTHFNGKHAPSGGRKNTKEDIEKYYLSKTPEKTTNNTNLKKWLFKFNLLEEKCSADGCTVASTWNKKNISLQLDHIDGDNTNNEITNLRILCPNCHSQTTTYAGKKNKK